MGKKIKVTYERESRFPEWATPQVLLAMHNEGQSYRKIGEAIGVSHEAVRLAIKKVEKQQG